MYTLYIFGCQINKNDLFWSLLCHSIRFSDMYWMQIIQYVFKSKRASVAEISVRSCHNSMLCKTNPIQSIWIHPHIFETQSFRSKLNADKNRTCVQLSIWNSLHFDKQRELKCFTSKKWTTSTIHNTWQPNKFISIVTWCQVFRFF